jgi:YcxB-like protein
MRLEFTITLQDYKAALRLHRKQKLIRRVFPWIWPSLFTICLATFAWAAANNSQIVATQAIALGGGSLTATIALPILRFINTRRCYMRMFPPTRTGRMTFIEINDQGIVEENPGTEEIRLPWSGVLDFVQNEKVTMVYINSVRFFLFPTTALTPEQRSALSGLVACHVGKR